MSFHSVKVSTAIPPRYVLIRPVVHASISMDWMQRWNTNPRNETKMATDDALTENGSITLVRWSSSVESMVLLYEQPWIYAVATSNEKETRGREW
jgi:hypothetical protein